jgi:hypothetical protein
MSHYGPPGGPHPGQPQDPWHDRSEDYTQPADPWGGQDPWVGAAPITPASPAAPASPATGYGYPSSVPPGGADPTYAPPGYGQPPAPTPGWSPPARPKRRASTPLVVLIALLALVVCGGLGVAGWFVLKNDGSSSAQDPTGGSATDTPKPTTTTGGAGSSTDAQNAEKGQCLRNTGTREKPAMQITKCATGTYEVLARFNGTKDYAGKCGGGKVPGYEFYYFYDSDVDTLDFVLCLKKRR